MDGSTRSGSGWRRGGLADPAAVARSRFSGPCSDWCGSIATGIARSSRAPRRFPTTCASRFRPASPVPTVQGLDTSFEVNPQLIGGMRIRVGSDVYDASVLAKLAALEARL